MLSLSCGPDPGLSRAYVLVNTDSSSWHILTLGLSDLPKMGGIASEEQLNIALTRPGSIFGPIKLLRTALNHTSRPTRADLPKNCPVIYVKQQAGSSLLDSPSTTTALFLYATW